MARILKTAGRVLPFGLIGACAIGALVRVSVRDRVPVLAALHYATPPIVLAVLAGAAGLLWALRRRWPAAAACLLGAGACVWWWHAVAWFDNPTADGAGAVGVMVWNVGLSARGWQDLATEIAEMDCDVVGLVEAGRDPHVAEALWGEALPGYRVVSPGYGLVLLARGRAEAADSGDLAGAGRYARFDVEVDGGHLTVLLVDVKSNPLVGRRGPLGRAFSVAAAQGGPLVLMGDFNTPTDSAFFEDYRAVFANAFEERGRGLAATWPVPVPLLALDQVWVGGGVRVTDCRLGWTSQSDHRPVIAELDISSDAVP